MSECRCVTKLRVSDDSPASLSVIDEGKVTWSASDYVPIVPIPLPGYEGPYEVTPAAFAQVIPTSGLAMLHDLTVGPIPSNYGLITWNGAVLTVS